MTETEQSNVYEPSTSRSYFAIFGTLSICFCLLALVGCSATSTSDRQQQVTAQSVPPIDISGWVTYTNADDRFAFRHPADWEVRPAESADQQYSVIALIYAREQAKALRECDKKHTIDTDPACRHWYREAMIGVRDNGYITYANLDALEPEKYTGYHKLAGSLDVFVYEIAHILSSTGHYVHVNSQDKTMGLTFVSDNNDDDARIAEAIAATTTFR